MNDQVGFGVVSLAEIAPAFRMPDETGIADDERSQNADANGLTVGIRSHCARGEYPLVKPDHALRQSRPTR
jgi:hypothetical protein